MARPIKPKLISEEPRATYFKPHGIPLGVMDEVHISLEELEALRLVDLQGLYQEDAAKEMGISRPTLQRMVVDARAKLVDALVKGKAVSIAGGCYIRHQGHGRRRCSRCDDALLIAPDERADCSCPHCKRRRSAQLEQRQPEKLEQRKTHVWIKEQE